MCCGRPMLTFDEVSWDFLCPNLIIIDISLETSSSQNSFDSHLVITNDTTKHFVPLMKDDWVKGSNLVVAAIHLQHRFPRDAISQLLQIKVRQV